MTDATQETRPAPAWCFVVPVVVGALARFINLGSSSSWLDETNSWHFSAEYGFRGGLGPHCFSQWSQALGLMASDSTWGLRLPAALFGTLAVAAGTWWAFVRLGPVHALCAGMLLALSPYGIFYSQDATHYGPLLALGAVAAIALDLYVYTQGRRRIVAAVLIACGLPALLSHPAALFTFAGSCGVVCAWLLVHAEHIPLPVESLRTRRIVLAALVAVAAAAGGTIVVNMLADRSYNPHIGTREIGLNAPFLVGLGAEFFGAAHHHQLPDQVAGIVGFPLSVIGWLLVARRRGTPWAAVGAAMAVVATIAPFFFIKITQFFFPRYLASASPALIMGVGLCAAEVYTMRGKPALRLAGALLCGAWLVLFAWRVGAFEALRFKYSVQPSMETLAWIREHTAPDAVVYTRHRYSAKSARFLWDRVDMGGRELRAVSYIRGTGAPAIQQIEEDLAATKREAWFFSFIEAEEHIAPDFDRWLRNRTEVVEHLPSSVPDFFAPIALDVTIRRIRPSQSDPFALPRDGVQASSIVGEDLAPYNVKVGNRTLALVPGMGAAYRVRIEQGTTSIHVRFSARKSAASRWIVAGWDRQPAILVDVPAEPGGPMEFAVPAPIDPGYHTLQLAAAGSLGMTEQEAVVIESLTATAPDAARLLEGRLLIPKAGGREEVNWVRRWEPEEIATTTMPGRSSLHTLVVVQPIHAFGTGPVGVVTDAVLPNGTRRRLSLAVDWTFGDNWIAGVYTLGNEAGEIAVQTRSVPFRSFRPWGTGAVLMEPMILTTERE